MRQARTRLLHFVFFLAGVGGATAQAAVGHTEGQGDVTPSGEATYTIPLALPPGINGLTPELNLVYGHRHTESIAGVGWGISGLSRIARCAKTQAQDGTTSNVNLLANDRLCVDGMQLKLTSGTYGTAGSAYKSEIDTITRYIAVGSSQNGPQYFRANAKNGLTYEYGNTADSRIETLVQTLTNTALIWELNRIVDLYGNEIVFKYEEDGAPYGSHRIDEITYRANPGQGVAAGYRIDFIYDPHPPGDIDETYRAGSPNEDTKRLKQIDIWNLEASPDVLIRRYVLGYEPTLSPSNRSRLASVTECAGSPVECFPATTFSYQSASEALDNDWGPIVLPAGVSPYVMDVNGDGRTDLVYASQSGSGGVWRYRLASGTGFIGAVNTNIANTNHAEAIIIDHNFDGSEDLLVPLSGGTWHAITWTGEPLTASAVNTLAPDLSDAGNAIAIDRNGDGREDLIWGENIGQPQNTRIRIRYRSASGNGFESTVNTIFDGGGGQSQLAGPTLFGANSLYPQDRNRKFDVDGDGKEDLAAVNVFEPDGGGPIHYFTRIYRAGNPLILVAGSTDQSVGVPIDINGDGYTDVAFKNNSSNTLGFVLSTGETFAPGVAGQSLSNFNMNAAVVVDWNQDGKEDLLLPSTSDYEWYYFESKGDSFATAAPTYKDSNSAAYGFRTDVDGDALDDLTYIHSNQIRIHRSIGNYADLLKEAIDGNGNVVKFTYTSIAKSNYTKGSGATFPSQDHSQPLVVVKNLVQSTGVGNGTYTLTYTYKDLIRDLAGRGLSIFGQRTIVDGRDGSRVQEYYNTTFPYRGRLSRLRHAQQDGTTIQDTTYTWSNMTGGTGIQQYYYPYVSASIEKNYEVGGTYNGAFLTKVETTTAVDTFGTPTLIEKITTEQGTANGLQGGTTYSETISNTNIVNSTSNWCLGQIGQTQWINLHSGAFGSQITRTVSRTWNSSPYCRVEQEITEPLSGQYKVTRAIGYDAFGNISSDATTGVGMPVRTVITSWGTSGQFPRTVWNPLSQQTNLGWDVTHGQVTSQLDPNGLVVSRLYDKFGRQTRETRPDGTYTTFELMACNAGNNYCGTAYSRVLTQIKASSKTTSGTEIRADYDYLDKADRVVQSERTLVSGARSRIRTIYDEYGRVYQQSMPSFNVDPPYFSTLAYDLVGRPVQISRPISAVNSTPQSTSIDYLGLTTTTTDAENRHSTQVVDALGRLYRSIDHAGYYQQFELDAFGSLRQVADSTNTLFSATYAYGIGALRLTSNNPMDLGAWSYTPNALGEVVAHTDAKGQNFSATFDKLSRPLTRVEPGNTTTWVWGSSPASKNIGRLQSISVSGHSKSYSYDSYGRLSQLTTVADATYAINYGYQSTTGLLDSMTYPTSTAGYRLKLKYDYAYGMVEKVSDFNAPSTVFWQVEAVDARGNAIHEALGSTLESVRSYDEVTGLLDYAIGGPNANGQRQNLTFSWSKVGNLTERNDLKRTHTEKYFYDNRHRLDYTELDGVQNLNVDYNTMGNITSKSDVGAGSWTYHPTKKHAVTAAPGFTFTYDANGNQTTRNADDISWTSYNYPSLIENGTKSHAFYYAGDRSRWKTVYNNGSATETTIEVGNALEKRSEGSYTEYRHYIEVNGQAVALHMRPSTGTPSTKYLLYDHQGNLDAVTTDSGGAYLSLNYGAFGQRRDPFDYTGNPPAADLTKIDETTVHGYTFHVHLEASSLIHMNGRVMDGLTGRFLSPDPYVFNPTNTQGFNRYSYVQNNPLTYTDPTGFCAEAISYFLCRTIFWSAINSFLDGLFGGSDHEPFIPKGCFVPSATACWGKAARMGAQLPVADSHVLPLSEMRPIEGRVLIGGAKHAFDQMVLGAWDHTTVRILQKSIQTQADIEAFEAAIGPKGQIAIVLIGIRKEILQGVVSGVRQIVRKGDVPKGSSKIDRNEFRKEREAYWKNEGETNAGNYSKEDLERMRSGHAPIGPDGHPMELHHVDRTPEGGLQPMSRTDHRLGENYQKNHPPGGH